MMAGDHPAVWSGPLNDLRAWIAEADRIGQLQQVSGANWQEEIGTLTDFYMDRMGRPALLFDDVPGYARGLRVLSNVTTGREKVALSLGWPTDLPELEMVRRWRDFMAQQRRIPPVTLPDGPILENVRRGADVDVTAFPTPMWHEGDGHRYIGTGCAVITRDPDTGWVNLGCYRVNLIDERTVGIMITRGRHGRLIMEKYWERGQACPIAVSFGHAPLYYLIAGINTPYGDPEYDMIGGLMGAPAPVVSGPITGLPLPAWSEMALEGEIQPQDLRDEGPFGEWTGYYAGGVRPAPVIQVQSMLYRNDPILIGAVPRLPPSDDTYYCSYLLSANIWEQMEKAGIPGIQGVWAHEAGGSRMWVTVSIKQLFPGHAKQAGLVAAGCHAGAYLQKFVVVVDEDISPVNTDEVIWAMCTRADAREDMDVIHRAWSSPLDPMAFPAQNPMFNSKVIIDACRPWERKDTFPPVARQSAALRARVGAQWGHLLEKLK